jgi:mycothiol system anti-sigma-R factor
MNEQSPIDSSHDCEHVLERMYEFLDNELDTATGDAIRHHLDACEPCLDRFDVELAVRTLVRRRCGGDVAPTHLRQKIVSQLTVIRRSL